MKSAFWILMVAVLHPWRSMRFISALLNFNARGQYLLLGQTRVNFILHFVFARLSWRSGARQHLLRRPEVETRKVFDRIPLYGRHSERATSDREGRNSPAHPRARNKNRKLGKSAIKKSTFLITRVVRIKTAYLSCLTLPSQDGIRKSTPSKIILFYLLGWPQRLRQREAYPSKKRASSKWK